MRPATAGGAWACPSSTPRPAPPRRRCRRRRSSPRGCGRRHGRRRAARRVHVQPGRHLRVGAGRGGVPALPGRADDRLGAGQDAGAGQHRAGLPRAGRYHAGLFPARAPGGRGPDRGHGQFRGPQHGRHLPRPGSISTSGKTSRARGSSPPTSGTGTRSPPLRSSSSWRPARSPRTRTWKPTCGMCGTSRNGQTYPWRPVPPVRPVLPGHQERPGEPCPASPGAARVPAALRSRDPRQAQARPRPPRLPARAAAGTCSPRAPPGSARPDAAAASPPSAPPAR